MSDKVGDLTQKRGELEAYLGRLAEKMLLKLEGTFSCPADLQLSTHHIAANSPFFQVCRNLSRLEGRDWADRDGPRTHKLSRQG